VCEHFLDSFILLTHEHFLNPVELFCRYVNKFLNRRTFSKPEHILNMHEQLFISLFLREFTIAFPVILNELNLLPRNSRLQNYNT
jgi:hypothetical protein